MPPSEKAYQAAKEKRRLFLALLADGATVAQACLGIGISRELWRKWRSEFPEFKTEADRLITLRSFTKGGPPPTSPQSAFQHFRKTFFGYDTPSHHARIIDLLTNAADDTVSLILAPPGHAKTTLMIDWICFRLAKNPDYRICVISESREHSTKVVAQVARRMTDEAVFGAFINRYGPFRAPDRQVMKPWTTHALTLLASKHDEKEPSLEARGAGSRIYGSRYDEVWLDDIQSTQNLTATDDLVGFFRQDVMTRPMETGKIFVIGTRVGPGDFYERLMDEDEDGTALADQHLLLPAFNFRQEPLWPEVWPTERLERRRKRLTPDIWSRVYMQRPVSSEEATFTDEVFQPAIDKDRAFGPMPGHPTFVTVDPAMAGTTALAVFAYDAQKLYLLDMATRIRLARNEDIINLAVDYCTRYHAERLVIEENAFQKGLVYDSRLSELASRHGFIVTPHKTHANKIDPMHGVKSMAGGFLRAELSIPNRKPDQVRPLLEQLRVWRPDVPTRMLKQDMVMALWFGYYTWVRELRVKVNRTEDLRMWRPTWVEGPSWRASARS